MTVLAIVSRTASITTNMRKSNSRCTASSTETTFSESIGPSHRSGRLPGRWRTSPPRSPSFPVSADSADPLGSTCVSLRAVSNRRPGAFRVCNGPSLFRRLLQEVRRRSPESARVSLASVIAVSRLRNRSRVRVTMLSWSRYSDSLESRVNTAPRSVAVASFLACSAHALASASETRASSTFNLRALRDLAASLTSFEPTQLSTCRQPSRPVCAAVMTSSVVRWMSRATASAVPTPPNAKIAQLHTSLPSRFNRRPANATVTTTPRITINLRRRSANRLDLLFNSFVEASTSLSASASLSCAFFQGGSRELDLLGFLRRALHPNLLQHRVHKTCPQIRLGIVPCVERHDANMTQIPRGAALVSNTWTSPAAPGSVHCLYVSWAADKEPSSSRRARRMDLVRRCQRQAL